MINWKNNKGAKILFIFQWLAALSFFPLFKIFFPSGDGSGAAFSLLIPCFGTFIILGIVHIIHSFFIEKDKTDRIFLTINIIAAALIFFENMIF